jgi:hypothetical protein
VDGSFVPAAGGYPVCLFGHARIQGERCSQVGLTDTLLGGLYIDASGDQVEGGYRVEGAEARPS